MQSKTLAQMSGRYDRRPKGERCCPSYGGPVVSPFMMAVQIIAASLFVLTAALLAVVIFQNMTHLAQTRAVLHCTGAQVLPGPGDPDGFARGWLVIDEASKEVSWKLYTADIAEVTHIHVYGPLNETTIATDEGELFIELCGVPFPETCDITSPIEGSVYQAGDATGLRVQTREIRAELPLYYVQIHTTEFPDGALRCSLDATF